ncbi:CpsD/CapB family tyrosine-protein kinase [Granulicella arctica]|uniref:CpsD/CapB family tyrosine-protein kinase n=1 Tax=Granulicella arctica TaxID=940613 RepID=UPI0021E0DE86|nr:CpsD/CapB family tyrosine-protein kinase [Granulicella arctica]
MSERRVDGMAFPVLGWHDIKLEPARNSKLVYVTEPEGLAVEQYKILRGRLCTMRPKGGVMLVTSPGPGEGKTLTSVNLAWSLAAAGQTTCLVDLDFRAPGVGRTIDYVFEVDGVEDVLLGRRSVAQSLRHFGPASPYILGIVQRRASPGQFLSPALLTPLFDELRTMFQWVILDFAPVIPMADVAEVISAVDGALMVARVKRTSKALVDPALEVLGSKLWGVVVNDSPIDGSSYYGYYGKQSSSKL